MNVAALCFCVIVAPTLSDDDKTKLDLIQKDLTSKSEKTRLAAIQMAEELGLKAAPILKPVCDRLLDPSPKVSLAALVAIEKISPTLYKPLSAWLLAKPTDEREIKGALIELARLDELGKSASTVLVARLTGAFARESSVEALALFDAAENLGVDDPKLIRALKELVTKPNRKTVGNYYRPRAVRFLTTWATGDADREKEIIPVIKAALADQSIAAVAAKCAGEIGEGAASLLPDLRKLKLSSDAMLRKAATDAVVLIEK